MEEQVAVCYLHNESLSDFFSLVEKTRKASPPGQGLGA